MIPDNNSKNEKKKIITPLARGFNFSLPALRPSGALGIKKPTAQKAEYVCPTQKPTLHSHTQLFCPATLANSIVFI